MIELQMIGNLGADATIKELNGRRYIAFSIGDNEKYTDQQGVKHERTTWVSCLKPLYNDNTTLLQYLTRGTQVFIRGRVSTKAYQSKQDLSWQASINCNVKELQLLSSKRTADTAAFPQPSNGIQQQTVSYPTSLEMPVSDEDNLPF